MPKKQIEIEVNGNSETLRVYEHKTTDCNPIAGYWTRSIEGFAKMTYCDSVLTQIKHLSNQPNATHKPYSMNWAGVPKEVQKKVKTNADLYNQFLSHPSRPAEKVKSAVQNALPKAIREILVEDYEWNQIQGDLNLDRIFAGRRKFMRRLKEEPTNSPIIGIGVQINALADIQSDILSIRSIVAGIAVEVLEKLGYCVELYGYTKSANCYSSGERATCSVVRIKKAGQNMSQSTILNATSSWAFRNAIFAMNDYQNDGASRNGQGSSRTANDRDVAIIQAMLPAVNDFAILRAVPRSNNFDRELQNAIKALMDCLKPYL
tara:strand:+ start:5165 stop:6121 length:957 start_codon:yes stop_codon:yes gene_type:complete